MIINVKEVFKTPVKRSELPGVFGCSDRAARKIISELTKEYNIINLQDGRGYFLADDETALKYAMQERSRGISALSKANTIITRLYKEKDYGIVVPVKAHTRRIKRCILADEKQINFIELEELFNQQGNFNGKINN